MAEHPFNHKTCDVPGYEHVWVQFRTSGYPRKLRREWDAAADVDATLAIVLHYVQAWGLTDLSGQPAALPAARPWPLPAGLTEAEHPARCLDEVEDAVVAWLVRVFTQFWLVELTTPRPNSLPPSPPT